MREFTKIDILNKKIDLIKEDIQNENTIEIVWGIITLVIAGFGIILIFTGFTGLIKHQTTELEINLRKNIDLPRYYSNCQSCYIKFSPLVSYGKEKDNKNNYAFCLECYNNGCFIEPDLTFEEMKKRILKNTSSLDQKRQKEIIESFEKTVRWRKDNY